jgi:uncharacterized protein (TIGR00266 family)
MTELTAAVPTPCASSAAAPTTSASTPNYRVRGHDLQFVEVLLEPQAALVAENKSMMYVDPKVAISTVLGDGAPARLGAIGRFWNALKRSFTGESMFSNVYKNEASSPRRVAIAAPGPGSIVALELTEHGGSVVCQRGAFLCGDLGTRVQIAFQKRLRTGFLGGEGFVMQKLSGTGRAFIHACGALKVTDLGPQDQLRVDAGCLVALAPTVRYDIAYTGSLKTSLFGGEGLFYATVHGPGRVWLQSMPMHRLSANLLASAMMGKRRGPWGKLYLIGIVLFVLFTIFAGGSGSPR